MIDETPEVDPMKNVFPNINEILTESVKRRLNLSIITQIKERYEKHGPEYISPIDWTDGRKVNQCMLNDSAQDAIEEVVDAVFNCLILAMKQKYVGKILNHLMAAYNDLVALKAAP